MGRPRYWLHSRETILLLAFVVLGVAFAVTGVAAKGYHAQRRSLAGQWHARGVSDLAAAKPEAAVKDFVTALVYGRENLPDEELAAYQLDLAESLVATGRSDEARSYLLDLWERAPGNGKINLDLARLAVQEGDDASARRYFESAIDGVWQGDSTQVAAERFEIRMEFYRYLASRGDPFAAQSVLLEASASLPPDSPRNVQVGHLMLDTGHEQQALALFEQALRMDSHNAAALAGAGLASFKLGGDAAAVRYLEEASRVKEREPQAALDVQQADQASRTLAIARETLGIDPFRAGLGVEDRAERAMRSYNAAMARLRDCAQQKGIALPKDTVPKSLPSAVVPNNVADAYTRLAEQPMRQSDLVNHPARVEQVMTLVFAAEAVVDGACGSPQDTVDVALDRIRARAEGSHP